MSRPMRFSIEDMLLATAVAALPLACMRLTGQVTAGCLSLMSLALTFGYGQASLALMCLSLITAAVLNDSQSALGACVTVVVITIIIALLLRFIPRRQT